MDFSPLLFHSSSSWYVLWALWVGSFWRCQHQGNLGDSLGVAGGGPCATLTGSQLRALACFFACSLSSLQALLPPLC